MSSVAPDVERVLCCPKCGRDLRIHVALRDEDEVEADLTVECYCTRSSLTDFMEQVLDEDMDWSAVMGSDLSREQEEDADDPHDDRMFQ